MRLWTIAYSGLADGPSRTVTGEVSVGAETMDTAARRAVALIRRREGRRGRPARLLTLQVRISRGGTITVERAQALEREATR